MSDEKDTLLNAEDSDPKEAEALQDILNRPVATAQEDSSVFEQNIFGAPPPSPSPQPQPQAQHPSTTPEPYSEPTPQPPPSPPREEDDVKIVTPEDFEKMTSGPPPPAPSGLTVNGADAADIAPGDKDADFPEIAAPPAATSEDRPEEREPPGPAEESAPLNGDIDQAVAGEEELPLETEADPLVLKAAKAKEGPQAVEETRELIEKLDGEEEGFLDAGEIRRGLKLAASLLERIEKLEKRIEQLENEKNNRSA